MGDTSATQPARRLRIDGPSGRDDAAHGPACFRLAHLWSET